MSVVSDDAITERLEELDKLALDKPKLEGLERELELITKICGLDFLSGSIAKPFPTVILLTRGALRKGKQHLWNSRGCLHITNAPSF